MDLPPPPAWGTPADPPTAAPPPSAWGEPHAESTGASAWGVTPSAHAPTVQHHPAPAGEATLHHRRRPVKLIVVAILVVAVAAGVVAYVANRGGGKVAVLNGAWQRAVSATGVFSVEFPGSPDRRNQSVQVSGTLTLSGATMSVGGGALNHAAVGAVFVEGDLTQVGLTAATLPTLRQALLQSAVAGGLQQIGATRTGVFTRLAGGDVGFEATAPGGLVISGAVGTSGTELFGVIVTVPHADAAEGQQAEDRMRTSIRDLRVQH